MSISRDTFDETKNYKRLRYHQDRDLRDSELNEQQDILHDERKKIADRLFKEGSVIHGLGVSAAGNVLTVGEGLVYIDGSIEQVPGAVLTYDPAITSGADYVYVELLKYNYGANHDAVLVNPATGEPTAEREKWVLTLKGEDTSEAALPNNVSERKVVAIYKFERESGAVTATVQEKSNLSLEDLLGTLPGKRITVSSITEDQLAFAAAEGLNSLLENLAERTFDQSGSYLVEGLDSFIGGDDGSSVEVVTNAGRAYIQGYRLQKDLPTTTVVPKSVATKPVRGEQKTFGVGTRRYGLNNTPLKETRQVEAIIATVSNITRGSVGGGEDLLEPNPVVEILEVSQGATVYTEGTDWQQSGNHVDWLGTGTEPAIGTTYTVRWTYTKQMSKGIDYADGGWFGQSEHPEAAEYVYLVTALDDTGETGYDADQVVSRVTGAGEINRLTWPSVSGGTENTGTDDFQLLTELAAAAISYVDDGVDEIGASHPPAANTSGVQMPVVGIALDNLSLVNFGRSNLGDAPVDGSNCSVDYDYYVGRTDVIYATTREIKRLEGAPADAPKLPLVPEGALGLGSIDCPPDSVEMRVINFGLTRVTMDQLHDVIQDVEDLKYNDAQFQMNNELQNRDAQTKKGIYSDDFSNDAQSDIHHPEWSARIDPVRKFVAPDRRSFHAQLSENPPDSRALFKDSLVLLPGTERVLIEQADWSEEKNINPYAVFDKPEATVEVTPNIGRRGGTNLINVNGANFTPNATGVTLRCDGHVMFSQLRADAVGRVKTVMVIPATVRPGNRIVELTDGTYSAQTDIQVHEPLVITRIQRVVVNRTIVRRQTIVRTVPPRIIRVPVVRTVWRWRWRTRRRDPLAQTFSFTRNRVVSAVGVEFTSKDAAVPVTVQIRGVTTGLPNEVVLAEKVVAPDEIDLGTDTKITFDDPFYAEANTSYAVVLLTNSNDYRVRIATLGQLGQNGVITRQTYAQGVLLESSNAETWTPLNASDMTLKIYGYDFEASGEVRFHRFQLDGGRYTSAINLDEYSAIPEGTRVEWQYSTDDGTTWNAIVPAEEETLPDGTTWVLLRALFTGGQINDTPALNFRDVSLIQHMNTTQGHYVSRQIELTQGVADTKVYAQMHIPSGTSVDWLASNDDGATWEKMPLESTREIDQEWTEYTLTRAFTDPTGNKVRYKARMNGTFRVYPRIHTLGATLS